MSEFNTEMDQEGLPQGLKILTVLTFIGNGLGVCSSIYAYYSSTKNLAMMDEMRNKPEFEQMPAFAKKMYSDENMNLLRSIDINKLPIMLMNLVGCSLCIYGAIEMRNLNRNGFYTYLMGTLLPIIGLYLFVGDAYFAGFQVYATLGFAALFIILYSFQFKHLDSVL